ncbi:MAG: uracil-DNA glycosylase [Chloroflexi bacterium]|nr:uracil-DNA glycosylase [Chloroflexota bacterium]
MSDLQSLAQAINGCTDCGLARSRTHAVPGEGSPQAQLMFIGEGPGFNEDQQGRPFIGPAGQFLDELLASIGLARSDVFITNMVKCRPPNNRDPFPGEMEACSKYLDAQIEAIKPKVIVPLGRHALAKWFPNESIGKVRAKARRFGDITLFPLYHPAAALHNGALRSTILDDFAKLGDLLRAPAPPPEATPAEAGPARRPPSPGLSPNSSRCSSRRPIHPYL